MKMAHSLKELWWYDFDLVEVQVQMFQIGHIFKHISLYQIYLIFVQVQVL